MLIYIDESGDSWFKFDHWSSPFFSIALVVFNDHDEAEACSQRIDLLRRELWIPVNYEFHFKKNSDKIRQAFLEAVANYNFFYHGFVLNKKIVTWKWFQYKDSFYKCICWYVFENAKEKIENATVIIDRTWSEGFKYALWKYLRNKLNTKDCKRIKKVAMHRSHTDNLVQLVDYVCGVVHRYYWDTKNKNDFRHFISHREINVQQWPKQKN